MLADIKGPHLEFFGRASNNVHTALVIASDSQSVNLGSVPLSSHTKCYILIYVVDRWWRGLAVYPSREHCMMEDCKQSISSYARRRPALNSIDLIDLSINIELSPCTRKTLSKHTQMHSIDLIFFLRHKNVTVCKKNNCI